MQAHCTMRSDWAAVAGDVQVRGPPPPRGPPNVTPWFRAPATCCLPGPSSPRTLHTSRDPPPNHPLLYPLPPPPAPLQASCAPPLPSATSPAATSTPLSPSLWFSRATAASARWVPGPAWFGNPRLHLHRPAHPFQGRRGAEALVCNRAPPRPPPGLHHASVCREARPPTARIHVLRPRTAPQAVANVIAQCAGAIIGSLLLWGTNSDRE